jgi:hypothetical protein
VRRLDRGKYHCCSSRLAQQLRQLGEVRRHAAGLIAGQPVGRRAALRFIVKVKKLSA